MRFLSASVGAALLALALAPAAVAHDGLHVVDPYARVSGPSAVSGAAFMVIENSGPADRLLSATSDVAERVELHTHKADSNGVMQMLHVPEGFAIPANGAYTLQRGGDHVMFLGLTRSLAHGDTVRVTLTFEKAGSMDVNIPVDLERKPAHGAAMGHAGHGTAAGHGAQSGGHGTAHKHGN